MDENTRLMLEDDFIKRIKQIRANMKVDLKREIKKNDNNNRTASS